VFKRSRPRQFAGASGIGHEIEESSGGKTIGLVSSKEECWFVGHADPGTVLGFGANRLLGVDELLSAALSGEVKFLLHNLQCR
jgi:hypothetical protein